MQFHNRHSHQAITLEYGGLVDRLKNTKQKDWIKACRSLGLVVQEDRGKGSHCRVVRSEDCNPSEPDCLVMTIPRTQLSANQRAHVKQLVAFGLAYDRYTEKDVWEALGIKIKH
ncbi:MAG: hypothetical protein RL150_379 [Candidatus Parcubacteria bacterium]|jgi:hypothetical protein